MREMWIVYGVEYGENADGNTVLVEFWHSGVFSSDTRAYNAAKRLRAAHIGENDGVDYAVAGPFQLNEEDIIG